MPWTVLLFAAGSLAIPAPSILLVPPHPSSQEDPIHIACVAPVGFPGANFTLYRGGQVVQFLQASADQLRVTFNVTGGDREAPGATFCCQYGVLAEHRQERLSDLSKPLQVSFPGSTIGLGGGCHLTPLAEAHRTLRLPVTGNLTQTGFSNKRECAGLPNQSRFAALASGMAGSRCSIQVLKDVRNHLPALSTAFFCVLFSGKPSSSWCQNCAQWLQKYILPACWPEE
ncbi:protein HIDE1 isoform X2 [Canis lupus familiaris]|uniref:protein HIDE1 isoform X2 n=1 Tax=Canis lupus familiaris TaxID=9615 RepID=UPI0018F4FC11|nr:protein HIDE1 isoform X2 [Canis lupus familiaris]XP_038311820.1 protein HIDE1 isoform X2 [Canis lupus familiaris]XP_038423203.1 protein HIDE1 isoform X2 [Canis lupus familiaris]